MAETISIDKLAQLTGYSASELNKLAGKGYFPKASKGEYRLTQAVTGCFKARREQVEGVGGLPTYESMKQCSSQTGIPHQTLKLARKESGVFKAHRVPLGPLLRWIFSRQESEIDWGSALKEYQAKREKIKLDKDQGEILDKGEVKSALLKGMSLLFSALDRQASIELPPALKGMTEQEIQQRLGESTEKVKAQFEDELKAMFKE